MNIINLTKILLFYIISYFSIVAIYMPYANENLKYIIPLIEASFIFYFYIYNDKKPLLIFLLIISIIIDAINNYQIGTNALIYFLSIKIFQFKSKLFIYSSFKETWLVFMIFLTELFLIKLLAIYYINNNEINFEILFINFIATIITYPIFHNYYYYLNKLQNIKEI